MDSYSRMGLSSHTAIVNGRQADLRREAEQARMLRANRTVDESVPQHDRLGSLRRLVATFGDHGRRAHAATRDALQAPAPAGSTLRAVEHHGS